MLQRLDLSGNALTGTLPVGIGQLTALAWLDISDNVLSGV
jgi:Leucine-rich repeat (LRR) protein